MIVEVYTFKGTARVKGDITYIVIPTTIAKAMKLIDGDEMSIDVSRGMKSDKPLPERIIAWFETGTPDDPIVATVRNVSILFTIPQTKAMIILTALEQQGVLTRTDDDGVITFRLKK